MERLAQKQKSKLSDLRQASEQYKTQAEEISATQLKVAVDLRGKLEEECDISIRKLKDLDAIERKHAILLSETETLRGQLAEQSEGFVQLTEECNEAIAQRNECHIKVASFQSQLFSKSQESEELRLELDHAKKANEILSKECENLQRDRTAEVEHADGLRRQVSTIKEELTSAHKTLQETLLELQNTRKENENNLIAAAARQKMISEENVRLLGVVGELEKQLSAGFLSTVFKKLKGMMMYTTPWIWWKSRSQVAGTDAESVQSNGRN